MTVGIIGACQVTLDFANRAVKSGHNVLISHTRSNVTLKETVHKMGAKIKLVTKDKAAKAKIIIVFVPRDDIGIFLSDLPDMTEKILIHTNNLIFSMECLTSSKGVKPSSEIISYFLPTAHLVKILTILEPSLIPLKSNVYDNEIFYTGKDLNAKKKVKAFLKTLNFAGYDFEEVHKPNRANNCGINLKAGKLTEKIAQ